MPKLEMLTEQQRDMLLAWPSPEHEDSPWTNMSKPLSECKVALVTTAGLHVRGDDPFTTAKNGAAPHKPFQAKYISLLYEFLGLEILNGSPFPQ